MSNKIIERNTLTGMDSELKLIIGSDQTLKAYYNSLAFSNYLRAKNVWQHVQLAYSDAVMLRQPNTRDGLADAANITRNAMMACLEDARNSPEHKAAFGW